MSDAGPLSELDQLRARVAALESTAPRRFRASWRQRAAVVGLTTVGVVAAIAGVAGASGTATTAVAFTPISPAYKVVTNGSVAAGKSVSYTVAGLPTTAPDDATTVQLSVTVKGAQSGTLTFYPAGNPAGGSGQTLSWLGARSASTTLAENVGTKNQLTVANSSSASATVTMTLTGYSTQVTAGDINGSGGAIGSVLTNTGAGAAWQPISHSYAQPTTGGQHPLNDISPVAVASVAVPAGSYVVTFTGTFRVVPAGGDFMSCDLVGPQGQQIGIGFDSVDPSAYQNTVAAQGQLHTAAGTITAQCFDTNGNGRIDDPSLIATAVAAQSGAVAS